MPDMGAMQQINSEPLRAATVLTPQYQAEQYAREAEQAAAEAAQSATDAQTAAESAQQAVAGAVKYSEAQTLTAAQQAQARANIGAGDAEDVADLESAFDNVIRNNVLFEDGSETLSGTKYVYKDIYTLSNVDVSKTYTLYVQNVTGATSSSYTYMRFLDADDGLISQRSTGSEIPSVLSVAPPAGTAKIVFRLYASGADALQGDAVYTGIKIYTGTGINYVLNDSIIYERLDNDEEKINALNYGQSKADNTAFSLASQGLYLPLAFVQGNIGGDDNDTDIPMSIRARTAHVPVKNGCKIRANAAVLSPVYRWYIWKYDSNGDWDTTVGVVDITDEYLINFDGTIRITVQKRDGSDFTNDDLIALDEHITVMSISSLNIFKYGEQLGDIASGADAVPPYWVSDLNTDIAKIQMLDAQVGAHGDSFVFITDTHVESNAMVSPVLIGSILKKTSVGKVVHGGDIFQSDYTKSGAIAKMYSWFSQLYNAKRYYQVRGNHDINDSVDGVSSDEFLTDSEYYGVCVKRSADYIVNPDCNPYYYFDNEVQKIRYFVLDTGSRTTANVSTYFTSQLTWMETMIDALDDTWGIVVLLHIMFTPKPSSDTSDLVLSDRGALLKAKLDSLYGRTGKPQIICVVCGHVHRDFSMVSSVGYPIIATACDTGSTIATDYDPVNVNRTPGTTNEQLFDVCHINKATRTINMTRIGAGADRSFTY